MQSMQLGRARSHRVTVLLAALVCTLIAVLTTSPENTGDAMDYAGDTASAPSLLTPSLYEPGHLLWRPTGVMLRDLLGRSSGGDTAAIRDAQRILSGVSIVAAVVVAASVGLLVLGVVGSLGAALVAVTLTALGAAVLNFAQAGAAYVPGIALVSVALWAGTAGEQPIPLRRAALAGGLLAAGVLLWLPFVLVVPAVLLAIYLLSPGEPARRLCAAAAATVTCVVIGSACYLGAAAAQGIQSLPAFVDWIRKSSHGISNPGLARVVIGLPRSFVHMGNDGREIRRYLLGDPLNPVSVEQLALLHVWPKLLLFYAVLACVAWYALRRSQGRVLLLLFIVALVPVVGLGAAWSGGEEERYLPLYPFLLLLVIWAAWSAAGERRRFLPAAVGAFALLWLCNVWAFNPWVTRARSAVTEARLGCIGSMLDARSVIVLPHAADPIIIFARDRLDEPPRSVGARVVFVVPPIAQPGLTWDGLLASVVTRTLESGGRVWIPAYALENAPPRWVGWVEGAQAVTWSQVQRAFGALEVRRVCEETALLEVVALNPRP